MADWIEESGFIVVVDEGGRPQLPREEHLYRWRSTEEGIEVEHVSSHSFVPGTGRPIASIQIEDEAGRTIFSWRVPGGPTTEPFSIIGSC